MNNERESDQSIPYVKVGDYYFPNFALPPDAGDIGFWGRKRREFLREHRPSTFNQLVLSGELFTYLALFNQETTERLESLIQAMKVAQGITEELKGRDQMAWVGAMNNIRACAEEIVYAELVYV
ncbi:MAG: TnpV protein [Clostridia bacterium]|nr:TnpV protein [Clostridia bacterium]